MSQPTQLTHSKITWLDPQNCPQLGLMPLEKGPSSLVAVLELSRLWRVCEKCNSFSFIRSLRLCLNSFSSQSTDTDILLLFSRKSPIVLLTGNLSSYIEPSLPFSTYIRTKLSKALITDSSKIEWKTAAELKIKYATNLRLGVVSIPFQTISSNHSNHVSQSVTSIDLARNKIVLDGGKDFVMYDKLILAPGGTPRRLPIPGAEFENVYTFRGIEDSKAVDTGLSLFHLSTFTHNFE